MVWYTKDRNIKIDVKQCYNVEWIQLTQVGSMTGPSEHGNEPSGSMKGTTTNANDIQHTISVPTTTVILLA